MSSAKGTSAHCTEHDDIGQQPLHIALEDTLKQLLALFFGEVCWIHIGSFYLLACPLALSSCSFPSLLFLFLSTGNNLFHKTLICLFGLRVANQTASFDLGFFFSKICSTCSKVTFTIKEAFASEHSTLPTPDCIQSEKRDGR